MSDPIKSRILSIFFVRPLIAAFTLALLVGVASAGTDSGTSIPQYREIERVVGPCSFAAQLIGPRPSGGPLAMMPPSLCINGTLAVADPDFNRPLASSTGTGIGTGVVGNCSLSGTATAANYDLYSFNLTGCAAFPTEVTITLCGPVGCQHVGNVDTMLVLYRNVPAGDTLTANGGLPAVFNPAFPCTNARGGQDDLGTAAGTTNNPGGATCNQVVGANCVAPCTLPSSVQGLSGMRRQLGNGRFTVVVAGFGNSTTGTYNLFVNAPAAGCNVALSPSAANVSVGGRVSTPDGSGLTNAVVTITDPQGVTRTARTSSFGYYRFDDVAAGEGYVISVSSKRFQFPSQIVNVGDSMTDVDFVAAPAARF